MLVCGDLQTFNGCIDPVIARLYSDGSVDPAFEARVSPPFGFGMEARMALQPDGRVLFVAGARRINGAFEPTLVRLQGGDRLAFRAIERLPNGQFQLLLNIPSGETGVLETTTNWTSWEILPVAPGPGWSEYLGTPDPSQPLRVYRLRRAP